jgi:hypothetical protein
MADWRSLRRLKKRLPKANPVRPLAPRWDRLGMTSKIVTKFRRCLISRSEAENSNRNTDFLETELSN